MKNTIRIDPRRILIGALVVIVLLALADVAAQCSLWFLGNDIQKFDLELEANIPTWFSSATMLVMAFLLAGITALKWSEGHRHKIYWLGMTVGAFLMSLDETAGLHEMAGQKLLGLVSVNNHLWMLATLPLLGLIGGVFARFLREIPGYFRKRMLVAIGIFLGGALVVEGIAVNDLIVIPFHGYNMAYGLLTLVEETMEMVGVVLFSYALLVYFSRTYEQVEVLIEAPPVAVRTQELSTLAEPIPAVPLIRSMKHK